MGSILRRLAVCRPNLSNLQSAQSTHLLFVQLNAFRTITKLSSAKKDELQRSFLVNYLISSCGVPPDRALSIAVTYGDKLRVTARRKPDWILEFLRNRGFTTAHIARVVSDCPKIFRYEDPEKTLSPKVEFFYSIGFTKQDLVNFLCRNPTLWTRSLKHHLIPLHSMIKGVLQYDDKVVLCLKRASLGLRYVGTSFLGPNIALLREIGVPQSVVAFFLRALPNDLMMQHAKFCAIVYEAKKLGFNVCKLKFVMAVHALGYGFRDTRVNCRKIYKEWGSSDDDIALAFQKYPYCLIVSEEKLTKTLDLLVNRMGRQVGDILKSPSILGHGLERRIIPRCVVIQLLLEKRLIARNWKLSCALKSTDGYFIKRYINKYRHIAPELLSVYMSSKPRPSEMEKAHLT
ncbi:hypothetical protein Dimus_027621 [Dionaea muscipula]